MADTTQGEKAESHSQPKMGVARTEQRDITKKAMAICFTFRSRSSRKGERVDSIVPMLYAPTVHVARAMSTRGLERIFITGRSTSPCSMSGN